MATPVGHALAGLVLYRSLERGEAGFIGRKGLFFVAMANLPDLDYVPGLLTGHAHAFHRGFTHTLLFACLASGLSALLGPLLGWNRARAAWLGGICCLSHLLIDLLTADWKAPYGVPLFWPFSKESFLVPVALFLPPSKASLPDLFQAWNVLVVFMECAVLSPFLVLVEWKRRKKGGTSE